MNIIQTYPNANGSRPPIQDWNKPEAPAGYTALSDGLDTAVFYEHNGFVHLTIEDVALPINGDESNNEVKRLVTSMTANTEAWEAWKASLPPEPEPEPTVEERVSTLEADKADKTEVQAVWDQMAAAYAEGVNEA